MEEEILERLREIIDRIVDDNDLSGVPKASKEDILEHLEEINTLIDNDY